ncbi:hypothetical protein EB118_09575, partial [bacterium]|nr:hypothetical protein [bacterium]
MIRILAIVASFGAVISQTCNPSELFVKQGACSLVSINNKSFDNSYLQLTNKILSYNCKYLPNFDYLEPGRYLSNNNYLCLCDKSSCSYGGSVSSLPIQWVESSDWDYVTEPFIINNNWVRGAKCKFSGVNINLFYSVFDGNIDFKNSEKCEIEHARILQASIVPSRTGSPSRSSSVSPSRTSTHSVAATNSATRTRTASASASRTRSVIPSNSGTGSRTSSVSASRTRSVIVSNSGTGSRTASVSASRTRSVI